MLSSNRENVKLQIMGYKGKVKLGIQTTANRKFDFVIDLQTEINLQSSLLKYNLNSKLFSRLTRINYIQVSLSKLI